MLKFKPGDVCILHGIEYVPNKKYNGTECTILSVDDVQFPADPYYVELEDRELKHCAEKYLRFKPGQREIDQTRSMSLPEAATMLQQVLKGEPA